MFIGNQRTISNTVSYSGKVSCKDCTISTVNFVPAEANTGIIFKRIDLKTNNEIKANYKNIEIDDKVGITLTNEHGIKVHNIEHIMSAIWGSRVDNMIIEVDCKKLPIVDGSAEPLLFLLTSAGIKNLNETRKVFAIQKDITVKDDKSEITIKPSKSFTVDMQIHLKNGKEINESFLFDYTKTPYKDTVSRARSFYLEENEKHPSKEDYKHSNEFARHEILDFTGALYLSGLFMFAEVSCKNGNHDLYSKLLDKIFEDKDNLGLYV